MAEKFDCMKSIVRNESFLDIQSIFFTFRLKIGKISTKKLPKVSDGFYAFVHSLDKKCKKKCSNLRTGNEAGQPNA